MGQAMKSDDTKYADISTWIGFAAMCMGMFMAILDVQIVATSLPTIQSALDIQPDQMSWVQTTYLTAEIIAIPLTGVLTRILGMRWLFIIAITGFSFASLGCALSHNFVTLVFWRIIQGFFGGTLIPGVFSAVFILFPVGRQALATTIGGVLAVLAPTIGPIIGGWITETFSWQWLFLINIMPGFASSLCALVFLPKTDVQWKYLKKIDAVALVLMALFLSALILGLKEAPQNGWTSLEVVSILGFSFLSAILFVQKTKGSNNPIVGLDYFEDRNFTIGCILSFVLGIGLFGSVYLMPVFLAFVRGHNAFEIGQIMLVTGIAQLVMAPIVVSLEQRISARFLTGVGFSVFAIGLYLSSMQTPQTDYNEMFWPQILRGLTIMFCLLPPIRMALGFLDKNKVPDASGVFNLMRNLGGAIGLALIDTIIYTRTEVHSSAMILGIKLNDIKTLKFLGVPLDMLNLHLDNEAGIPMAALAVMQPLIEKASLTLAINGAWLTISGLTIIALLTLFFVKKPLPNTNNTS